MPTSASTTPTSVTLGKSKPLAIICVPSRMSTSPRADAVEDLGVRPLAARRVDVHARDARRRKAVGEQALDLLRAESALAHHAPRHRGQLRALAARRAGSSGRRAARACDDR